MPCVSQIMRLDNLVLGTGLSTKICSVFIDEEENLAHVPRRIPDHECIPGYNSRERVCLAYLHRGGGLGIHTIK